MRYDCKSTKHQRLRIAREQLRSHTHARASKYIDWLPELVKRHGTALLAIIYIRVSSMEQRRAGNLKNRLKLLKRSLRKRRIKYSSPFCSEVIRASVLPRPALSAAAAKAKQLQSKYVDRYVFILTDTPSRFVRNREFVPRYPSTHRPTDDQWIELTRAVKGVPLATRIIFVFFIVVDHRY